jgi:hypothetical protein
MVEVINADERIRNIEAPCKNSVEAEIRVIHQRI